LARRISEKQKQEIIEDFLNKKSLEEISEKFKFTKLTITRNLKKNLGEKKYNELIKSSKLDRNLPKVENILNQGEDLSIDENNSDQYLYSSKELYESEKQESFSENSFLEIVPLDYEIDKQPQRDLSSISIFDAELPKTVYLIVDKNIELKPKLLKEYPDWSFLSEQDLNRKTIEIYFELKIAKRYCSKEQKVIKVPDSNVFKITAQKLISQGITRIVSSEMLIAL